MLYIYACVQSIDVKLNWDYGDPCSQSKVAIRMRTTRQLIAERRKSLLIGLGLVRGLRLSMACRACIPNVKAAKWTSFVKNTH